MSFQARTGSFFVFTKYMVVNWIAALLLKGCLADNPAAVAPTGGITEVDLNLLGLQFRADC